MEFMASRCKQTKLSLWRFNVRLLKPPVGGDFESGVADDVVAAGECGTMELDALCDMSHDFRFKDERVNNPMATDVDENKRTIREQSCAKVPQMGCGYVGRYSNTICTTHGAPLQVCDRLSWI